MARRMFSPKITSTDIFLDMPVSARELYFQLGMNADDDGFITPKRIMRMIGSSDDDLKVLLAKNFVIGFRSGVIVISAWRVNNLIRKDWYQETIYKEEKAQLMIKENGEYNLVNEMLTSPLTQDRLGKDRLGKDSIERETPSQKTKDFFNNTETQELMISTLKEKGINEELCRREIGKFISYWTELNKSGTKQHWELEQTFEVNKRLTTWFNKIKDFQQNKSRGIAITF